MIRPGRPGDAAALAALAGELGYPTTPETMTERLEALREDTDQALLVDDHDGDVRAWIQIGTVRALESGAFAEIRGLVVGAPVRGRGIGGALVAAAEAWARSRGIVRVRVRSRESRGDAHRFYERLGYAQVKTQLVLDKPLDPA